MSMLTVSKGLTFLAVLFLIAEQRGVDLAIGHHDRGLVLRVLRAGGHGRPVVAGHGHTLVKPLQLEGLVADLMGDDAVAVRIGALDLLDGHLLGPPLLCASTHHLLQLAPVRGWVADLYLALAVVRLRPLVLLRLPCFCSHSCSYLGLTA